MALSSPAEYAPGASGAAVCTGAAAGAFSGFAVPASGIRSNISLGAPQSGHFQSAGRFSHLVPAAMPAAGMPWSSS